MCCFHSGIARKGQGGGGVKASQDGLGHFFVHVCPFERVEGGGGLKLFWQCPYRTNIFQKGASLSVRRSRAGVCILWFMPICILLCCKDHPKDSLRFNNSWHNRTSKIADFPTVPVLILDLCIWLSWLQFNGFWKLQFKLRLRIMVSKKWIDQFSCQFWPFMAENFLGPDLLSPSGNLGIGVVWDNHPHPTGPHQTPQMLFGPIVEIFFKLN